MLCVQIAVLVLLLQGIEVVWGQFDSFNNVNSGFFDDSGQFQQVFTQQQPQFQQSFSQQQFQQGFAQQPQNQQFFTQQQQPQNQQFFTQQQSQFQQQQQQGQIPQFQQGVTQQPMGNVNDGNPRTRPPGNLGTSGTTPPPTTTTAQPEQVLQCRQNCPITSEYNPVCGTDGQSYNNRNVLRCARSCGINVRVQRSGPCLIRRI